MKITAISKTNFCAKYKTDVKVKHLNRQTGEYENKNASFVEMEPHKNNSDYEAMRNFYLDCDEKGMYICNIFFSADELHNGTLDHKTNKIYVVTSQNNNFENIESDKILGAVDITESGNRAHINYIEGNPQYTYKNYYAEREYKNVGDSILEGLDTLYKVIDGNVVSCQSLYKFYTRNGYKKESPCSPTFIKHNK